MIHSIQTTGDIKILEHIDCKERASLYDRAKLGVSR